MRVSVSKKIMAMVILPIICICIIAGLVTSNITRTIITEEIEIQLRTGAYGISQTLKYDTLKTEVNKEIADLCSYTNIDVTVFGMVKGKPIRVASTIDGAVGTQMDTGIYMDLQSGKDYFATDAKGNKIKSFSFSDAKPKQKDICHDCQMNIARILNLMKYVNINATEIEDEIFVALNKAKCKGENKE